MRLASLRIVTSDVRGLTTFYETITGLTAVGGEDYVEIALPGSVLAICSQRAIDAYSTGAASPAANRSVIVEFDVADVDAEFRRLATVVDEWVQEPTDQPWGNRSMLFRDPDGHLINFVTPFDIRSPLRPAHHELARWRGSSLAASLSTAPVSRTARSSPVLLGSTAAGTAGRQGVSRDRVRPAAHTGRTLAALREW